MQTNKESLELIQENWTLFGKAQSAAHASKPFQAFLPLKTQAWALLFCFVADRMVYLDAAIYKQFLDFLRVQDWHRKT